MARRYAENTTVSIGKSRGEIDDMLRRWGCCKVGWFDEFDEGLVRLQFIWEHEGAQYAAQFSIQIPDDESLRKRARHASTHEFLPLKYERLRAENGRTEHRQLALWLKAAFNAVESGIILPEQVFLPWLMTATGETLGERMLPELPLLVSASGPLMLGAGT